jgi:hypothetical protein
MNYLQILTVDPDLAPAGPREQRDAMDAERVGGYGVVECRSLSAAVRWESKHPHARMGSGRSASS